MKMAPPWSRFGSTFFFQCATLSILVNLLPWKKGFSPPTPYTLGYSATFKSTDSFFQWFMTENTLTSVIWWYCCAKMKERERVGTGIWLLYPTQPLQTWPQIPEWIIQLFWCIHSDKKGWITKEKSYFQGCKEKCLLNEWGMPNMYWRTVSVPSIFLSVVYFIGQF